MAISPLRWTIGGKASHRTPHGRDPLRRRLAVSRQPMRRPSRRRCGASGARLAAPGRKTPATAKKMLAMVTTTSTGLMGALLFCSRVG
jgi:hypothetical protein